MIQFYTTQIALGGILIFGGFLLVMFGQSIVEAVLDRLKDDRKPGDSTGDVPRFKEYGSGYRRLVMELFFGSRKLWYALWIFPVVIGTILVCTGFFGGALATGETGLAIYIVPILVILVFGGNAILSFRELRSAKGNIESGEGLI